MPSLPLFVSPGDNLVARIDDLVVFAHGDTEHLRRLTLELTELLPETNWSGLLRYLASQISTQGFDSFPPITCVQATAGVTNVFVFGDLAVSVVTSTTTELITGAGMTTWREATVDGDLESISAGAGDDGEGVLGMLTRGLVSGGGFRLAIEPAPIQKSMLSAISGATTVAATAPILADDHLTENESMMNAPAETIDSALTPHPQEVVVDDPAKPDAMIDPDAFEVTLDPDEIQSPRVAEPASETDPDNVDTITTFDDPDMVNPDQLAQTETISVATNDAENFDPNATTAFGGAAISDAVREARAASPDPRRSSGPEGEASEPLETTQASSLRGILCPNEHLSSMQDSVCRTCSEPVDVAGPIVAGPRPILGVIEFDDGVRIPLDRPVVIGRQPPEDYQINGESAYVVPITDAEGLISRVHVEVHLIGWDVELIDKNSVNGTFTSPGTDSTSRTKLRAEHPTQIELGTIIYTGDRVFRFNTGRIV